MIEQSESIAKLGAALAKAQAAAPNPFAGSYNEFIKSNFADMGAVLKTLKPVMAEHGLAIVQLPGYESAGDQLVITVCTQVIHAPSGEWLRATAGIPHAPEKGKSLAQVAGSIITYLRRYGICAVLQVVGDIDSDGETPMVQEPDYGTCPIGGSKGKLWEEMEIDQLRNALGFDHPLLTPEHKAQIERVLDKLEVQQ